MVRWGRSASLFGNEIGSFPEGFTSPKRILAIASSAPLAGIPGFQNCLHVVEPGHQNGVAVLQHDDGMGIRGRNLPDQFILIVRQ